MPVAYLINQYPKVSHSFIRREIRALERLGIAVARISIRGWNEPLVDSDDLEERSHTHYVLRDGALPLFFAVLQTCVMHPIRFLKALLLEIRRTRHSDRRIHVHLIYLAEACLVLKWMAHKRISHLHAHFGTNSAEVAMLVGVLGGPPWSFTVHGPEEFDKARSIGLAEKIRRAKFVVAISSYGRSQLFRLVDHSHWSKIQVVRCGIDRELVDKVFDRPPFPQRLVCIGRICEQKGQLLLLEAARLLTDKGVQFELVLAGDGEMRPQIDAFIKQNKLASLVRVTGWISNAQVRDELLAARALVLPSFAEGLPVVIMEAMALQRPVITTYVAGIPELVISGQHGWLVPAGDVQDLANAIQACLAASDDELSKLGQAAHERVEHYHDSDEQASRLQKLFTERHL